MFAQYVPEGKLNLGSANTFSNLQLPDMPSHMNYDPSFQVNDPNGASFRPDVSLEHLKNKLGRFMTLELKPIE